MIPRLPDSSLWGHFLSNHSRLHRDWQLVALPSGDLVHLDSASSQMVTTSQAHALGNPESPPSFEIYIFDVCFLPSSVTTTKPLSSFWHLTSALHCGLLPNMAVRAVFLKAEAIPRCLRLPTALGTKSRLLKHPARRPALEHWPSVSVHHHLNLPMLPHWA